MKALLLSRDELGIDINAKGEDGMTALNRAISEGYLGKYIHIKKRGIKITPPVLIEDHTMHFTPVLNLRC